MRYRVGSVRLSSSQEWFRRAPQTAVLLGSVLPAEARTVLTFLSSRFADPDRMKVKFQSWSQPKSSNRDPFSRKFFFPLSPAGEKEGISKMVAIKGSFFSLFRGNARSQRRFCFARDRRLRKETVVKLSQFRHFSFANDNPDCWSSYFREFSFERLKLELKFDSFS